MTFNWRSYIDAVSANVQRLYSKDTGVSGLVVLSVAPVAKTGPREQHEGPETAQAST